MPLFSWKCPHSRHWKPSSASGLLSLWRRYLGCWKQQSQIMKKRSPANGGCSPTRGPGPRSTPQVSDPLLRWNSAIYRYSSLLPVKQRTSCFVVFDKRSFSSRGINSLSIPGLQSKTEMQTQSRLLSIWSLVYYTKGLLNQYKRNLALFYYEYVQYGQISVSWERMIW